MRKVIVRLFSVCAMMMFLAPVNAQEKEDKNILNHMSGAVTAGTAGIGIDLSMPIGDKVRVRAGYTFVPSVKTTMHFGLTEEKTGSSSSGTTGGNTNGKISKERFLRYKNAFGALTGYELSRSVAVYGRPTMQNGKLLVDVFPFRNKKWSLTGGIFFGPRSIARAYNTTEAMPLLLSVGMHNHLVSEAKRTMEQTGGKMGYITITGVDNDGVAYEYPLIIAGPESDLPMDLSKRKLMGFQLGDYFLTPDEDGMVKATAKTDPIRPYLGFGYGDYEPRGDKKYGVMLECGLLWWGGTPVVDCYGTDLATQHVKGSVGGYINVIKALKVFPVINIRISRRLF